MSYVRGQIAMTQKGQYKNFRQGPGQVMQGQNHIALKGHMRHVRGHIAMTQKGQYKFRQGLGQVMQGQNHIALSYHIEAT